LARTFDKLLREGFEGMDLQYLLTQAAALPLFQKACRDWLDDPDLTLGYRLFAALGGMPETVAGLVLWRLAALAHAERQTEAALLAEGDWPRARTELGRTEHGRTFLRAWEAFMAEHGHHCRGELEFFNARWAETPDYILGLVRGYLRAIDQCRPVENQRRLAEEREQLTEQCRRRLRNPLKRWLFARSLRRAQKLAVNREEWKNQAVRHLTVLRRILLALGQRLWKEGVLGQPDDVFFLEVAEVEPVATAQAGFDVQASIADRRKEYARNLTLAPPPVVVGRFDPNTPGAPAADTSASVLQGIPVYPGAVTGVARVILRTDDHEQVLPGEILVAPFTDPAWTPYFVPAAGVVIEQGGLLSHGSIVAREYGLPAVTNVASATRIIRTGDLVQVDGSRGRVLILKRG
jgi:pyruvate,water dikinase